MRRERSGPLAKAVSLLGASHPGPVAAVTTTAVGLAASAGGSPVALLRVGAAVLSGQLAIGWQNDYLDAARDGQVGRTDKPVAAGRVGRETVGRAAAVAAIACLPTSLMSGRRVGGLHLAAVASGLAYNLGLKATPASFVPYGLSFGLLPRFAILASRSDAVVSPWASLAGSSLGLAAHFVNVLPDRDEDRELGVLGLPQRLSAESDIALAGALLGLSSLFVAAATGADTRGERVGAVLGLGLSGAVIALARRSGGKAAFRLVLALALLDVARLIRAAGRRR